MLRYQDVTAKTASSDIPGCGGPLSHGLYNPWPYQFIQIVYLFLKSNVALQIVVSEKFIISHISDTTLHASGTNTAI